MSSRLGTSYLLRPCQALLQVFADSGPLVVDDREVGRIADADDRHLHVLAMDALEPRWQRFHRRPRALVAGVGLQLDPHAAQVFEGEGQHQQLRLDVGAAAPGRGGEPGVADLHAVVDRPRRQVGGAAERLAVGAEGGEAEFLTHLAGEQAAVEPLVEAVLGLGDAAVDPLPDLRLDRDRAQRLAMALDQRLQAHLAALQAAVRRRPDHAASSRKRSKRWRASCGPGPASGWYWTVAPATSRRTRPSTVRS